MKIIESDEIGGHAPEFLEHVSTPTMRSGKIASIDTVCTGEPRNAPEVHGCLEEKLKYPVFTRFMAAKKKKQNIRNAVL